MSSSDEKEEKSTETTFDVKPNIGEDCIGELKDLQWLTDYKLVPFVEELKEENPEDLLSFENEYIEAQQDIIQSTQAYAAYADVFVSKPQEVAKGHRRPNYTYGQLIDMALYEHKEMSVSEVYKWIMEHFPYYRWSKKRWRNSIRHHLSINPAFTKGRRAKGHGFMWKVADGHEDRKVPELELSPKPHWKKQRLSDFEISKLGLKSANVLCMKPKSSSTANTASCSNSPSISEKETMTASDILSGILCNESNGSKVEVEYLTPPTENHCWACMANESIGLDETPCVFSDITNSGTLFE